MIPKISCDICGIVTKNLNLLCKFVAKLTKKHNLSYLCYGELALVPTPFFCSVLCQFLLGMDYFYRLQFILTGMTQLSIVFERILDSIQKVFSNVFGWIIAVFTAYLSWLGNDSGSILLVVVALVWDMAWGIAAAVKRHNFVLSYLLRETFCKIIVYVGAMSIVLFAERMLGLTSGLTVRIIAVIATSVELFSSAGNILIIKPDFVFVRFFGKYLVGEIADKMKISHDEARQMLDNNSNNE